MIQFIKSALLMVFAYAVGIAAGLILSYGFLILVYGTAYVLKG